MFDGFSFARHAWRAILPTVPAVAVVLLMRQFESGARSGAMALVELVVYLLVTVLATWLFEGSLIREALSYLVRRGASTAPIAIAPNEANTATSMATRAPWISLDNTSRPRLSVPSG